MHQDKGSLHIPLDNFFMLIYGFFFEICDKYKSNMPVQIVTLYQIYSTSLHHNLKNYPVMRYKEGFVKSTSSDFLP